MFHQQLQEEHQFLTYLRRFLVEKQISNNNDTKTIKILKIGGKTFAISMGFLSGIPYIEVARQFAGRYTVIGYMLAYGMVGALASVTTWALLDVVNDINAPEKTFTFVNFRNSKCKDTVYWIATPLLGFSSAIPMGYIGYQYNGNSPFFAAIALFSEFVTNTCSLNRVFRNIRHNTNYCRRDSIKKLNEIKNKMSSYIEISTEILINMKEEDRVNFLRSLGSESTISQDSSNFPELLFYNLIKLSQNQAERRIIHEQCNLGIPKILVRFLSLMFPIAWSIVSFQLAFDTSKYLTDNIFSNLLISVFSVSPGFLLESSLAQSVFILMYSSLINLFYNTHNKTFPQLYYPKINVALTILGLSTAFLAFGSRAKVVLDYIAGDKGIFLMTLSIISTISYKSSAMLSLIRDVIEYSASKFGEKNIKSLYNDIYYLRRFSILIHNSSLEQVEKFLCSLDLKKFEEIVGKESIFFTLVTNYILNLSSYGTCIHPESLKMDNIDENILAQNDDAGIATRKTAQREINPHQLTILFDKNKTEESKKLLPNSTESSSTLRNIEENKQSNFLGRTYTLLFNKKRSENQVSFEREKSFSDLDRPQARWRCNIL